MNKQELVQYLRNNFGIQKTDMADPEALAKILSPDVILPEELVEDAASNIVTPSDALADAMVLVQTPKKGILRCFWNPAFILALYAAEPRMGKNGSPFMKETILHVAKAWSSVNLEGNEEAYRNMKMFLDVCWPIINTSTKLKSVSLFVEHAEDPDLSASFINSIRNRFAVAASRITLKVQHDAGGSKDALVKYAIDIISHVARSPAKEDHVGLQEKLREFSQSLWKMGYMGSHVYRMVRDILFVYGIDPISFHARSGGMLESIEQILINELDRDEWLDQPVVASWINEIFPEPPFNPRLLEISE